MPKNEGSKGQLVSRGIIGGIQKEPPINTPTLAEVGLTKKQSSKAANLCALPYNYRYDLFRACNERTLNKSDYRQLAFQLEKLTVDNRSY